MIEDIDNKVASLELEQEETTSADRFYQIHLSLVEYKKFQEAAFKAVLNTQTFLNSILTEN